MTAPVDHKSNTKVALPTYDKKPIAAKKPVELSCEEWFALGLFSDLITDDTKKAAIHNKLAELGKTAIKMDLTKTFIAICGDKAAPYKDITDAALFEKRLTTSLCSFPYLKQLGLPLHAGRHFLDNKQAGSLLQRLNIQVINQRLPRSLREESASSTPTFAYIQPEALSDTAKESALEQAAQRCTFRIEFLLHKTLLTVKTAAGETKFSAIAVWPVAAPTNAQL